MNLPYYLLIVGGIASLLVTLLHIVLLVRPQLWRYFDAAELSEMHQKGSPFIWLVTTGLVLMFVVWALYAFSGAGLIRPLPFIRTILISTGIIYILRSLMLPSEIVKVIRNGYPFRFILLSMGSLAAGLLYLFGAYSQ